MLRPPLPAGMCLSGGVFTLSGCSTHLTAMLATGYSAAGGIGAAGTFWRLQSSLGEGWGEGGYMRLGMGQEGSPGECGSYKYAVAPLGVALPGERFIVPPAEPPCHVAARLPDLIFFT